MLLSENERELQRIVHEFYNVCVRRKLKVKVGKSKVTVFERKEGEVDDFSTPYRVSVPVAGRCQIDLGERMEKLKEFKYLGIVLWKHGETDGEIRERVVKDKSVIGSLLRVMERRNVSMEVKRGLRNSILLPALTY